MPKTNFDIQNESEENRELASSPFLHDLESWGRIDKNATVYPHCNESLFGELHPLLRRLNLQGAVAGVGAEQVPSFLAEIPGITEGVSIDMVPGVELIQAAQLEVSKHFYSENGRYPTPEEFFQYFDTEIDSKLAGLISVLENAQFSEDIIEQVLKVIRYGGTTVVGESGAQGINYTEVLRRESELRNEDDTPYFWFGSEEGIARITQLYDQGDLGLIGGNIADPETLDLLKERLGDTPLAILYLSNLEAGHYLADPDEIVSEEERKATFYQQLRELPWAENAVIVRTVSGGLSGGAGVVKGDNIIDSSYSRGWHYNIETVSHLFRSVDKHPNYCMREGWKKLIPNHLLGPGFSFLR